MKTKEELETAWKHLSTHPDFKDCLADLMRNAGFWRAPSGDLSVEAGKRTLITYILSKLDWKEVPADFTFEQKTRNYEYNRK